MTPILPLLLGAGVILLAVARKKTQAAAQAQPAAQPSDQSAVQSTPYTPIVYVPPQAQPVRPDAIVPQPQPQPVAVTYTVKSGDYAGAIAQKLTGNGGRWPELIAANPQKPRKSDGNFATLYPGEVLLLPASWSPGSTSATPAQAPGVAAGPSVVDQPDFTDDQLFGVKYSLADWGSRTRAINPTNYGGGDVNGSIWNNRDREATQSYQKWAVAQGEVLPTDGTLDDATARSLVAYETSVNYDGLNNATLVYMHDHPVRVAANDVSRPVSV
jgi:LysM repeat protein